MNAYALRYIPACRCLIIPNPNTYGAATERIVKSYSAAQLYPILVRAERLRSGL